MKENLDKAVEVSRVTVQDEESFEQAISVAQTTLEYMNKKFDGISKEVLILSGLLILNCLV